MGLERNEGVISGLTSILIEVLEFLDREDADLGWASHREVAAARLDYRDHLERVTRNDFSRLFELTMAFAPTAELQEASMASGWAERYIELAAHFDRLTAQG